MMLVLHKDLYANDQQHSTLGLQNSRSDTLHPHLLVLIKEFEFTLQFCHA